MPPDHLFDLYSSHLLASRLRGTTTGFQPDVLEQFYSGIFDDWELHGQANASIDGWTGGHDHVIREFEDGWTLLAQGAGGNREHEWCAQELYETREDRWRSLATALHIGVPTHFRLYRGIDRSDAATYVLREWARSPDNPRLVVPGPRLASWSFDPKIAKAFATSPEGGAIFEAIVPFDLTLADKWVDDGAFLTSYADEEEVIVCTPIENAIASIRKSAMVLVDGAWYGFDDRHRLFDALEISGDRGIL